MIEIVILGRGGQGAQTAGNLLAQAFFAGGSHVQTFSTYGGARRGTPVMSSLRVDSRPVRLRCNVTRASALLCFDDSLLDETFLAMARDDAPVVVNSSRPASDLPGAGRHRIVAVDGKDIARRSNMGKVVNSALLGGFAAVLGQPDIETLCRVIDASAPAKKAENVAACRAAHDLLANTREEA